MAPHFGPLSSSLSRSVYSFRVVTKERPEGHDKRFVRKSNLLLYFLVSGFFYLISDGLLKFMTSSYERYTN